MRNTPEYLQGAKLKRQDYAARSEDWDHDHCACCWAKFAEGDAPDILHAGYTTTSDYVWGAEYEWVCDSCFVEFKDRMRWIAVD